MTVQSEVKKGKHDESRYQILVFGKTNCDKCELLEKRIDRLLASREWADFTKIKFNLDSEPGLVEFCSIECMNPQRVPGFVITGKNPGTGEFELLPNPHLGKTSRPGDLCDHSRLYTWLGLQTDYSERGKGVITPKMITTILDEARNLA